MQALTRTLFPCYAAADREIATQIASFLEAGAGVRVLFGEGEMRAGEDLVRKAREARMADVILVLDNGRLVQTGTHDQLAHRPGIYHETALLQLMDLAQSEGRAA